ncbi:MAG: MBL fold metallo-hydrolase [Bacteroidetes bacterium]|nr:MBL fold metallo-hydrolase [Bacteroidota bacterium]
MKKGLTRREMLKLSGGVVGGLALGSTLSSFGSRPSGVPLTDPAEKNSLFDALPVFPLGEELATDEMRITFLGTSCIPRLSQECNSIFVEVGSGDQFVFDCGTGVVAKYNAMGIPMSRMNKIFLTHLHGDHMSDLTHIYCFGPAEDRKSPLYIWGPCNSGFTYTDPDGNVRGPFDDGTKAFCEKFREVMRWHTESFSFGATSYPDYEIPSQESWGLPVNPVPVGSDTPDDGFAIIPIELDWTTSGIVAGDNVAYDNPVTKVKITHFPVIHCRQGSIGYKLEWNGLSMIFSGDTKPNYHIIRQASGVDVFIHEMVMPADVWATKNSGLHPGDPNWPAVFGYAKQVQNSSHTPQGAFGYILSQITPPPRLTVATHFQAADDTIASAMKSVRNHYPAGEVTFATDLMVLNVSKTQISQRRAVVSAFAFYPVSTPLDEVNTPKYWKYNAQNKKVGDPFAQIDITEAVPAVDPDTGDVNYDENGY